MMLGHAALEELIYDIKKICLIKRRATLNHNGTYNESSYSY